MTDEQKSNYGIIVPLGISRHPDGTPMTVVHPEHKAKAIEYIQTNVGLEAFENMPGKQKEEILTAWRIADDIANNPPINKWTKKF